MAEKKNKTKSINIKNKRASFDFLLLDKYTAGIVLTGTEIKSIRAGKASLVDTFCFIHNGEVWVKNMYVAEYSYGSYNNHAARRDRKLLLNRKEIRKLQQEMKSPGFTLVPTLLFIDDANHLPAHNRRLRRPAYHDPRKDRCWLLMHRPRRSPA